MLRNTVLWLSALLTTGFGLALLFAPASLSELYGAPSTDGTVMLSRIFGAVTLGFTVLAVLGRGVESANGRRAVDATFLTGYALIALTNVWNVWQFGTADAALVVWSTIAAYVLFAIAFAYFLFGEDMRTTVGRPRPT